MRRIHAEVGSSCTSEATVKLTTVDPQTATRKVGGESTAICRTKTTER
jgi:hypothetical protein